MHLWTNGLKEFSDVNILVGGEVFLAHRVVLGVQSEYFRKKLSGEVKQTDITLSESDVTPNAFRQILQYAYTGSLDPEKLDGHVSLLEILCTLFCVGYYHRPSLRSSVPLNTYVLSL